MSHPSVGKRRLWTATARQPSQRNVSNVVSCTVRKSVVGLTENVRTTGHTRYRIPDAFPIARHRPLSERSLDRDARARRMKERDRLDVAPIQCGGLGQYRAVRLLRLTSSGEPS
jgi:hypothetical protein